jgi:hypothetical protein
LNILIIKCIRPEEFSPEGLDKNIERYWWFHTISFTDKKMVDSLFIYASSPEAGYSIPCLILTDNIAAGSDKKIPKTGYF